MAELISDLKRIKKMYGEKFMQLCRELFPTILEKEGVLTKILEASFSTNSRTLGEDIIKNGLEEKFKNFIFSKVDVEKEEIEVTSKKSPYELLEEAGYDLYECSSEKEIQGFKKYYKPGEELCTFNGGRLYRCVVFWTVKKDVDKIKRNYFKQPKREDEYGTSVMSIQFSRGKNSTVSIKNRYNHKVNNPDATYGNDLDRIIPGLTHSFTELLDERGIKLKTSNKEKFRIKNYTVANDGKYYKYNREINGIYYCPGNVIIDHGEVKKLESEKKELIDYFILDKEKKTLKLYDSRIKDSFINSLENKDSFINSFEIYDSRYVEYSYFESSSYYFEPLHSTAIPRLEKRDSSIKDNFINYFKDIEKIQVTKNLDKGKKTRIITIQTKNSKLPIKIEIDKENNIIGYDNQEVKEIGDRFLYYNKKLKELNLPQLTEVGDRFLSNNEELRVLNLPQLIKVGDYFISDNKELKELNLPQLTEVGDRFLSNNEELRVLNLPQLIKVGDCFLSSNKDLEKLNLPKLTDAESEFLYQNEELKELNLPQLTVIGCDFLFYNKKLKELNLSQLTKVGPGFLSCNKELEKLNLPQLEKIEAYSPHQLKKMKKYFLDQHPRRKRLISNMKKANTSLTPKDIAELDLKYGIMTIEVDFVKGIIEKIKNMFYKKDNSQR